MSYDASLEEMWKIKRELSDAGASWSTYVSNLMAFQDSERSHGMNFAVLPIRKYDKVA